MAFMEQSFNKPSEPSKGSGGDPMAAWRSRQSQQRQPQHRKKIYGAEQGSASPDASPAPAPNQPMRSRYGSRGGNMGGGAGGGGGMAGGSPAPQQGNSPFLSLGNMGGVLNTPGLPGYTGGGGGVPQASQDRMIGDAMGGRAVGPNNQMTPPAYGRGGRFGGSMGDSMRDFGGRMGAFQDRMPTRSTFGGDQMAGLRDRFAAIMRQRQMQQPAPRPTGLGGLVAANNANIRGRGGELNEIQRPSPYYPTVPDSGVRYMQY